jgi:hypothetical protein
VRFAGTVATFTDADPAATATDFTAAITWDDGSTSAGTVAADPSVPGRFDVLGSRLFARDGVFPLTITVVDQAGLEGMTFARSFLLLPTSSASPGDVLRGATGTATGTAVVGQVVLPRGPDNHTPGPLVVLTRVQVLRSGRRGIPRALVLTFSGALDPTVAANPRHYNVYAGAKPKKHRRRQRLVNVLAAAYDPSRLTVTLRVGKVKNRKTLGTLEVLGLLDSVDRPGGNRDVSVNLQSRRPHH